MDDPMKRRLRRLNVFGVGLVALIALLTFFHDSWWWVVVSGVGVALLIVAVAIVFGHHLIGSLDEWRLRCKTCDHTVPATGLRRMPLNFGSGAVRWHCTACDAKQWFVLEPERHAPQATPTTAQ